MKKTNSNKDKKKNIKELEILADEVLKHKAERDLRRPLLIEFCGSPKSGKSTTITSLNIFLKRNGFKTVVLSEQASISPIKNKTHPFFNLWTLSSAISEIVQHLDQGKDKVDIIIADRGIFDALCWFEWLRNYPNRANPSLDDEAFKRIKGFIEMDLWKTNLDLVYVFQVDPKTSIIREYANLLTEKRGSIMKESVLESFNKSVGDAVKKFGKNFNEVTKIKTDTELRDNNPNHVSYEVTSNILGFLKDLLIEKIGYLELKPNELPFPSEGISKIDKLEKLSLKYNNRDEVENNNDLIQPIPIAVITNKERNKVLVVKKSRKSTTPDSPERDSLLLYIGGHIRKEDDKNGQIIKTIEKTLHREIQEEIGESITIKKPDPFLIYTPITKKSKQHFAICYIIEMDLEGKKFKLTSDEFIQKTGTTKSGRVLTTSQVINESSELEPWSIHILKHVFGIKVENNHDLFSE